MVNLTNDDTKTPFENHSPGNTEIQQLQKKYTTARIGRSIILELQTCCFLIACKSRRILRDKLAFR